MSRKDELVVILKEMKRKIDQVTKDLMTYDKSSDTSYSNNLIKVCKEYNEYVEEYTKLVFKL